MFNPYQFAPYQTPYAQQNFAPQYQPQAQNTQPTDDRIFVANAAAADAYLVAPNGFVRLWDSSTNRFYEKQADASGRQYPVVAYEYKRFEEAPVKPAPDYEARFKAIEDRLTAFEGRANKRMEVEGNE